MQTRYLAAVALSGMAICASTAQAGPEWIEQADAGDKIGTAQKTYGSGQLGSIVGTLAGNTGVDGAPDFEDMFLITVTNPALFSMSIVSANFNAQLFVFNVTLPGEALGLLANDDTPSGINPVLTPTATDSTGSALTVPGIYAIAISGSGRNPTSNTGLIFNYQNPTEVSGPDGVGGINPHTGWTGTGVAGTYTIVLTGASFYDLPAPGALALFGLAGVCGMPRRRR